MRPRGADRPCRQTDERGDLPRGRHRPPPPGDGYPRRGGGAQAHEKQGHQEVPDEKLYEEVLSDKENTLPSFHERIRIAKVREYAFDEVTAATEKLEALSKKVDIPELIQLMKRLVPEYKSQNSEFEKYDRKD